MNQSQVKEIYLRVIEATIDGVRTELRDKGVDDASIESLNVLKDRWQTRVTTFHEFTDDPEIIEKPSSSASAKGSKKGSAKNAKKKSVASPKSAATPAASRNGAMSVASLTNRSDDTPLAPASASSAQPLKGEPSHNVSRNVKTEEEPPAKRLRYDIDEEPEHGREDLDSSDDSDINVESEEFTVENLVLAQHDRVKKGQKWKVILREGIVSIRGREYLFNKATCDLDF